MPKKYPYQRLTTGLLVSNACIQFNIDDGSEGSDVGM